MSNDSNNVLVVVDLSAWLYMTVYNAFNSWSKKYKLEFSSMIKPAEETDQDNIPNLLVSESFKKELKNSTMKKLSSIDWILKRNCQDVMDIADEIVIVFAEDDFVSNNFRRKAFADYKAQRNVAPKSWDYSKAKNYIVNSIFPDLDIYKKNGYIRIGCPNAEADDVIAVLMTDDSYQWAAKILISSDHDFCQLENVKQFNVFGEEVYFWVDKAKGIKLTPEEVVLVKSLAGDGSDGIPQVASRMGVKTAWKFCKDRAKLKAFLKENANAAKQYDLNKQLIDFKNIPNDLREAILKVSHEKLDTFVKELQKSEQVEFDLMEL